MYKNITLLFALLNAAMVLMPPFILPLAILNGGVSAFCFYQWWRM